MGIFFNIFSIDLIESRTRMNEHVIIHNYKPGGLAALIHSGSD
jgi:hypothetical protein